MPPAASSRLDALTSLRFFAAMMIVLQHTYGAFGIGPSRFNLQQGVSFFYVLSGFILFLVYPRLQGWVAVRKFWRARFARVWPAYILALVFAAFLVGYAWRPAPLAAYLLMVQSWIPLPAYFNAYNSVGWSVATEWFFYLVFPLLVLDFERTWKWKLAATFAVVVALAVLCGMVPISQSAKVWELSEQNLLNTSGVMYINPLARLFEFVLGMCVALAWRRRREATANLPVAAATVLELVAVGVCAASMLLSMVWLETVRAKFGFAFGRWYFGSGSALAFALLIYVIAVGRGYVSRALAWRPLVLGGEISFSIYLLHPALNHAYQARFLGPPTAPDWVAFASFLAVVWLASYVAWSLVELPVRRWLVGGNVHGSSVVTEQAPAPRLAKRLRPALALVALVAVGVAFSATTVAPAKLARATVGIPDNRANSSCYFEFADTQRFANNVPLGATTSVVKLKGWFLSMASRKPSQAATLRFWSEAGGGSWETPIGQWHPRPDVLKVFQVPDQGDVGFEQRFDINPLPRGTYRLFVLFEDGGQQYACYSNHRLAVGGG